MRRTDTRPSSGERLSTPPGGGGNGGEGRESSSANAQHHGGDGRESFPANEQHHETTAAAAPSATSSNMIADLANALRQVLQMTNAGGPTAPTADTYESRPIEIRQKNEMLVWSGKVESGQSVGSAFRVFRGSVIFWASAEGLMDVLRGESIPVGVPDVDLSRLRSYFGKERVDKSLKLWSQLIAKITAQPVQEMIFAAGSPQKAWRVFDFHYAVKSEHEREIAEDEWNELRQRERENIMSFYGRAKAIRMKLASYGDKRSDASMCKHIARRMLPSFKLCIDHVLLLPDFSSRTMEYLLGRAAHELEHNGRSGEEREETKHALTAAGVGRGDRCGRNAGNRGYGERDRTYTYCALHGEGQGHNTPECIVMRREFDRYYGDFHKYLLTRGLGPYAGRGGGRGAEGKYRQQTYPNDSGPRRSQGRWSRGHPPEQQRPPPPGHGPGTGGYANTYPGGRGHENWHHPSGGRGRGRGEGFGQMPPLIFPSN